MPPGFGLLDALIVAIPALLGLVGLLRGAPVELASCCTCIAGFAAAWAVSCFAPIQALGQPVAPLLALVAGVVVWRLMGALSHRFALDTRWIELNSIVDAAAGGAMGALRGLALVSVGCLAYATMLVPLGFANPSQTAAYPVFLAMGAQATSIAVASAQPTATLLATVTTPNNSASVPLPAIAANVAPVPVSATSYVAGNGPGLAALVQTIVPPAAAAPVHPLPAYHPDIPVRGIPAGLIETHHNILHPFGSAGRRHRH